VNASWQRRRQFLSSWFLDLLVMSDTPQEKGRCHDVSGLCKPAVAAPLLG